MPLPISHRSFHLGSRKGKSMKRIIIERFAFGLFVLVALAVIGISPKEAWATHRSSFSFSFNFDSGRSHKSRPDRVIIIDKFRPRHEFGHSTTIIRPHPFAIPPHRFGQSTVIIERVWIPGKWICIDNRWIWIEGHWTNR